MKKKKKIAIDKSPRIEPITGNKIIWTETIFYNESAMIDFMIDKLHFEALNYEEPTLREDGRAWSLSHEQIAQ